MLWGRHAFIRSVPRYKHRVYSTKNAEPLRILFCGSDEFSIASLKALVKAKDEDAELIESIDVVHRPGKRTGRGLKVIREVPLKHFATQDLDLPTHEIDTFTGWTPPLPINLIIAVSFGLLVPPRLLNAAKYGGLNVHPSLLPDLRGAAPIHHTLLQRRSHTGLSIQTLHPKHFDHGLILAQTPSPGIPVPPDATPSDLISSLGPLGGDMLVQVLKTRSFLPPLEDRGWYTGPISPAPKITKEDSHIVFHSTSSEEVLLRHRVLGDLWAHLPTGERIIMHTVYRSPWHPDSKYDAGLPFSLRGVSGAFPHECSDGEIVMIGKSTVEGGRKGGGNKYVMSKWREDQKLLV